MLFATSGIPLQDIPCGLYERCINTDSENMWFPVTFTLNSGKNIQGFFPLHYFPRSYVVQHNAFYILSCTSMKLKQRLKSRSKF